MRNMPATGPVLVGMENTAPAALSLLAFLGLRHPVRMLPILLFEVIWKVVWIGAIRPPPTCDGGADAR
jgi:hypothetical protein